MKNIINTLFAFVIVAATTLLSATVNAETVTYYHLDALGSPVAASDQNGSILWREEYAPYGDRIRVEDPTNTHGFTGKFHEEDLGLTYFGARWYDPVAGRFMGVDPVEYREGDIHSFNRYAYANNNPYKFVDPDGRMSGLAVPIAVGMFAIGTGGAVVWGQQDPQVQQDTLAKIGKWIASSGLLRKWGIMHNEDAEIPVGDLPDPLHSDETLGNRPDLGDLSDDDLVGATNNPKNDDPVKINTKTGNIVDGNSRIRELKKRANDPNSKISPDTKIRVEPYTPDDSMYHD